MTITPAATAPTMIAIDTPLAVAGGTEACCKKKQTFNSELTYGHNKAIVQSFRQNTL